MSVFRLHKYAYPSFEEVGCFWYFTIRTNGCFTHCVIMQFIDIKKSQGTRQVFTCPDTAKSLLSFICSRHVTPVLGEALAPLQLSLLPQLCMWPLPSFLIKLWQARIVRLAGYYTGNLLPWMLADPKISFFTLFCLCFRPNSSPKLNSMGHDQEQEFERLVTDRVFPWQMDGKGANDRFYFPILRRIIRKSHLLSSPLAMSKAQGET